MGAHVNARGSRELRYEQELVAMSSITCVEGLGIDRSVAAHMESICPEKKQITCPVFSAYCFELVKTGSLVHLGIQGCHFWSCLCITYHSTPMR